MTPPCGFKARIFTIYIWCGVIFSLFQLMVNGWLNLIGHPVTASANHGIAHFSASKNSIEAYVKAHQRALREQ